MQTKIKATRATAKKATPATATDAATATPATDAATATPETIAYKSATRDAATVAAQATHFAQYTGRDDSYLAFFGDVMRGASHSATLAQIHNAGQPVTGKPHMRRNPRYTGSAKATDAGAINRLVKAGYFVISDNGNRLTATEKAKATAIYAKA
jgi:hypothetical protein